MWNNNERGTTLVEVIVGMAILSIAIAGGSALITNYQNARNIRKLQTTFRFLAIQATLEATNNYAFYPPVAPPSATRQPVYVACYNFNGDKVQNNLPGHSRDFQFHIIDDYKDDVASVACSRDNSGFEVRFFWLSPFTSDIKINILNLRTEEKFRRYRNFKIYAK